MDIYRPTGIATILRRYRQRRVLHTAVVRACARFGQLYPEWAASLFDQTMIERAVAGWIVAPRLAPKALTAYTLAAAWATQLSAQPDRQAQLTSQALPIAAAYLRLLEHELPAAPRLLPIYVPDESAQHAVPVAMAGGSHA
jgi:hypothetical protein